MLESYTKLNKTQGVYCVIKLLTILFVSSAFVSFTRVGKQTIKKSKRNSHKGQRTFAKKENTGCTNLYEV